MTGLKLLLLDVERFYYPFSKLGATLKEETVATRDFLPVRRSEVPSIYGPSVDDSGN